MEKKNAIKLYHMTETKTMRTMVTTYTQTGACGGIAATKRLPKKAAVFGLEKLVNKPRRKAVHFDAFKGFADKEDNEKLKAARII